MKRAGILGRIKAVGGGVKVLVQDMQKRKWSAFSDEKKLSCRSVGRPCVPATTRVGRP